MKIFKKTWLLRGIIDRLDAQSQTLAAQSQTLAHLLEMAQRHERELIELRAVFQSRYRPFDERPEAPCLDAGVGESLAALAGKGDERG